MNPYKNFPVWWITARFFVWNWISCDFWLKKVDICWLLYNFSLCLFKLKNKTTHLMDIFVYLTSLKHQCVYKGFAFSLHKQSNGYFDNTFLCWTPFLKLLFRYKRPESIPQFSSWNFSYEYMRCVQYIAFELWKTFLTEWHIHNGFQPFFLSKQPSFSACSLFFFK